MCNVWGGGEEAQEMMFRRSEKLKFNKMLTLKKVLDWIVLLLMLMWMLCMDATVVVIIIIIFISVAMMFNLKEIHNIANDVQ